MATFNNELYKIILGEDTDVTIPVKNAKTDFDEDEDEYKEESKNRHRKMKEEDDKEDDKDEYTESKNRRRKMKEEDDKEDDEKDEYEESKNRCRKMKEEDDKEDEVLYGEKDAEDEYKEESKNRHRKMKEEDDKEDDKDEYTESKNRRRKMKEEDDKEDDDEYKEIQNEAKHRRKMKEEDDKDDGDDDIDWDIELDDNEKDDDLKKEGVSFMGNDDDDAKADNDNIRRNYKDNKRSDAAIKDFMTKGEPKGKDDDAEADDENKKIKKNYKDNERKDIIKLPEIKVEESLEQLFDGETLSEEFKEKVAAIYEAAIVGQRRIIFNKLHEAFTKKYTTKLKQEKAIMAEQIDGYLSYVAESWVSDNEIALESGIRVSLMENFVSGMKTLFESHYVDMPEQKFDVVKDIHNKFQNAKSRLNEEIEKNAKLTRKIRQTEKQMIISESLDGLSDLEKDRVSKLLEDVSFTGNTDEFRRKVGFIKENYMDRKNSKKLYSETPSASTETMGKKSLSEVDILAEQMSKLI